MTNAIAIARNLVDAGIDKQAAEAIAEVVVTHSDDRYATKVDIAHIRADIVRLEGKIETLTSQVKLLTALVAGLYIGLALLFVDRIMG